MSADQMAAAGSGGDGRSLRAELAAALVVGGAAAAAALIGIFLRPSGDLSAFWPANAVLLGLLIRHPRLAKAGGWIAAALALVAADVLTGSSWNKSAMLSICNLGGIGLGYVLSMRLTPRDRLLQRPASLVAVMLIILAASLLTSLLGAMTTVFLFHGGLAHGFFVWLAAELANYIVILPIVLTFPGPAAVRRRLERLRASPPRLGDTAPLLSYLACLAMVPIVGGPGALAFPVPSLLWCALTYGLAASSVLTLSFAISTLVALSITTQGMNHLSSLDLLSLRLGVMLVALAPIAVASAMAERNELLAQAQAARKAAEEAMAARTLLLATMAHELRSPLTAVVGFSGMMAKQSLGPVGHPKYLDYAQTIEMAGSHLNDLVSDLLDTARVEAGKFELSLASASSRKFVEQSLRLVRGLAVDGSVSLIVAPGDWPEVHADPRAIKQVLINLLSNAVKFSPPGGVVEISGRVDQDRLVIQVSDNGPGIAPEDLPQLGRPYAQVQGEETRRRGWGLGLMLSGELVAMHGGVLRLESNPGAGATAIFDLPLA
ncbi:ATP-binding protein [Phenylobacterium sp.]|uniref:sensor histidine kinase n=1 Tax=Phenylobacterium sp. TaxID=1871053 RepID=UPI0035ADF6A9